MKAASGGGIDRTGNFSFHERYYVIAPAGIRIGDRIEKKSGVRVERLMENILCATQLAEPAQEHDSDPVGNIAHYGQVVADEEVGQSPGLLQVLKEMQDRVLRRDVQGGDGFVAHDESRIRRYSPGYADPLALPAGELVGIAV